jgi:Kef-type K+ transport system membrane component KefB
MRTKPLAGALKGNDMKNLLTVEALIEAGTGLVLVALPSLLATLLLGSSLDTPVALTVARVAGVALLALGVACWLARHDGQSRAARGLVGAMVLDNAAVVVLLVYAGIGSGLSGIGLRPVVLVHAAMTVWCAMSLLNGLARSHPIEPRSN